MAHEQRDPWVQVRTYHDLPADQVISALQKEIRRGNTENACLLAYEMMLTSAALEDYLWHRLQIISVEDVGFGAPTAPVLIHALQQMVRGFDRQVGERRLFAIHAVRYLCQAPKDRSSDEMINWLSRAVARGEAAPTIPDYALDMHTAAGQEMGRGRCHFFEEGAQIHPELADRDRSYLQRILNDLERE